MRMLNNNYKALKEFRVILGMINDKKQNIEEASNQKYIDDITDNCSMTISESDKKFLIFINNKEISSVLNELLTENQRMIKTKYIVSIGIRIHLL